MRDFSEMSASAERVADAAEVLIQERGYNGFSYDDISRIVGIKKPTIHHHFATKAELVSIVSRRYAHRFRDELARIDRQHGLPIDRLKAYADLFANTYAKKRRLCIFGMLGAEADDLPEEVIHEVALFFRGTLKWLSGVFAAGRGAGSLRFKGSPNAVAEAYLCALEGSMIVGRGLSSAGRPAEVARTFIAQLVD